MTKPIDILFVNKKINGFPDPDDSFKYAAPNIAAATPFVSKLLTDIKDTVVDLSKREERRVFYINIPDSKAALLTIDDAKCLVDTRTLDYIRAYDTTFMMPIYVKWKSGFAASIMTLPWLTSEQMQEKTKGLKFSSAT
jgi:hypothetical protein